MAIKFNLHNVVNTETGAKARINYSIDNRADGRACVTVYGKDVLEKLYPVFGGITANDSDSQTDYFESDRVRLFPGHPLYAAARLAGQRREEKFAERYRKHYAG